MLTKRSSRTAVAFALVLYVLYVALIRIYAPSDKELFEAWTVPETSINERLNLLFVFNAAVMSAILLKHRWRAEDRWWRLFQSVYLFFWLGEESQWGQAIFHFPTPAWWQGSSGKNVLDLHTARSGGCLISAAMVAATGVMFARQFQRVRRGEKLDRLFLAIPLLVLAPSVIIPACRAWLWQLLWAYFFSVFLLLEILEGRATSR